MRIWAGLSVIVSLAWACLPRTASAQEPLFRIGTVSGQIEAASADTFRPFTDYLSSRIPDARFEMVPLPTIEALLAAADERRLEFAFSTPVAFVELNARHRLRPIATVTQLVGDEAYPWLAGAVFVKRSRQDLQQLADVRGQRVIALSPLALGGWLSAVREWRALGIDPERDVASLRFIFSYAKVAAEVCSGTADVGVLSAATLSDVSAGCPDGLRVLPGATGARDPRYPTDVSTQLYPEAAFAVVGDTVDERLVTRVALELLAIEPGSDVAKAAAVAGFTAPLSYTPVQQLMEELRIGPFESFGRLTFAQALQQHAGKVLVALLGFLSILTFGFVRTQRLNKQLEVSEGFRKRVFEGSLLPIVVMDASTLRFIDCNPAATEIYGFSSRADTLGKMPLDVSALVQYDGRSSAERARFYIDKALAEGLAVFEWRHQRANGELWDAEVHLMSFRSDDRQLLQFTLQDITERKRGEEERKRLEEQLHHSQRMDSIGRLAGAVAHDFNNLLTVINGYSEMLLGGAEGGEPSRHSLAQIHNAGRRAAELTHQLLTFSKKQISQPVALDLNTVVRESETMFSRLLGEDVHLVTSPHASLWLTMADPGQVHQVLMNLVVNGRDAMPTGGTLTIATDNVNVSDETPGQTTDLPSGAYAVLSVSDTGVGMDADTRQHIFEPFFSTKGAAGTGLGLSTVYGIVRQSQGGISVSTQPGAGSTFRIYLPRTEARVGPAAPAPGEPAPQPVGSPTILIVEDQDDVRGFARAVLHASGYHVLEAASGDTALALGVAQTGPIHLLLTDVVLRGMNGRELSERFRLHHPETRILFTSGYTDDIIARRGVSQGSLAFLPKPYSAEGLRAKVMDVLNGSH